MHKINTDGTLYDMPLIKTTKKLSKFFKLQHPENLVVQIQVTCLISSIMLQKVI